MKPSKRDAIWNGIRAKAKNQLYMQGNPDFNHYDISVEDSVFELSGNECGKNFELLLASYYRRPCGIFLNNMKDVTFKNVQLRWKDHGPDYQSALVVNNCPGLRLIDCEFHEPKESK